MTPNLNSVQITINQASKPADAKIIFCTKQNLEAILTQLNHSYLNQLVQDTNFKASASVVLIAPSIDHNYKYLILTGLGDQESPKLTIETYRRALAQAIKQSNSYNIKALDLILPDNSLFKVSLEFLVAQTAIISNLTTYKFDLFTTEDSKKTKQLNLNLITNSSQDHPNLELAIQQALIISQAVNAARSWIDLPANYLTPTILANHAQTIAQTHNLVAKIYNGAQIKEMGLGGLSAVAQGSPQDCRFVILEYHCGNPSAPTIALVGKGITYDTGGLSLKPTSGMLNMKYDMAGAASVLASMQAIGELKPNINVIGCTPLTENVLSGTAYKPGDIVKFYNGKTALINNTDAEGRVILADALAYVNKNYQLAAIIDAATLTGAARIALGRFFNALLSEHDELAQKVAAAGNKVGDYVWRLPLTDDYKPAVKSDIADLENSGKESYSGGTITAACFLQHFVGKTPWVHLDIAPTAFDAIGIPYFRANSATGTGVRLFIELVMNWDQN